MKQVGSSMRIDTVVVSAHDDIFVVCYKDIFIILGW